MQNVQKISDFGEKDKSGALFITCKDCRIHNRARIAKRKAVRGQKAAKLKGYLWCDECNNAKPETDFINHQGGGNERFACCLDCRNGRTKKLKERATRDRAAAAEAGDKKVEQDPYESSPEIAAEGPSSNSVKERSSGKARKTCPACGKYGHPVYRCWKLNPERKEEYLFRKGVFPRLQDIDKREASTRPVKRSNPAAMVPLDDSNSLRDALALARTKERSGMLLLLAVLITLTVLADKKAEDRIKDLYRR